MECQQAQILLTPYILGELRPDSERCVQLEAHLLSCPVCQQEHQSNRWTVAFLEQHRNLFAEVFESVNEGLASGPGVPSEKQPDMRGDGFGCFDDDTLLMLLVEHGDHLAFGKLYKKYFPAVTEYLATLCGHLDYVEDVAQAVFTRVWQKREAFRVGSSAKTYFFAVARNVLNEQRRRIRRQAVPGDHSPPISYLDPITVLGRSELNDAVERAKAGLSAKQRQALELAFCSGLSMADCARLSGCSPGAFRLRVHEGKKRLVRLFRQSGHVEL